MPRTTAAARAAAAKTGAAQIDTDADNHGAFVQRRIDAGAARAPQTTAAKSAFHMAAKARKRPDAYMSVPLIDIASASIEHGLPIPPRTGGFGSKFSKLAARMQPSDSFAMPTRQAVNFIATVRKSSDEQVRAMRFTYRSDAQRAGWARVWRES